MADRLTDAQMLKLVEIYRDYECLWNVSNTLYKNRDARESAYKNILDRLNIPGLSVKDIPKKIKNVRSSYYQELKRIEKSTRSGAGQHSVYKPKVSWFTTADGFLKAFRNNQNTFANIIRTQNMKSAEHRNAEENSNQGIYCSDSNVADDNIEDDSNVTSYAITTIKTEQNETNSFGFCIEDHQDSNDIQEAIAKIDKIANSVTKTVNSHIEKNEDEFDTFGKYIATTLRSLPKELGIVAKTDIQMTISEIQLKALRQNTQSTL